MLWNRGRGAVAKAASGHGNDGMTARVWGLSAVQLAESDTRLELVAAAAGLGVWDWDLTTQHMEYSERAKEIFGFPRHEPVTIEQVRAATHPDDQSWTSALANRTPTCGPNHL